MTREELLAAAEEVHEGVVKVHLLDTIIGSLMINDKSIKMTNILFSLFKENNPHVLSG